MKKNKRTASSPAPSLARRSVLQAPALAKGGAHGKTRKAERRADKVKLARNDD